MQSRGHVIMSCCHANFNADHGRELFNSKLVYTIYKLAKIPQTVLLKLVTNDLSCKLNSCVEKAALAEY